MGYVRGMTCSRLDVIDVPIAPVSAYPVVELPERPWVGVPEGERVRKVRVGRRRVTVTLPALVRAPLIVNYGLGTDSTALLVILVAMYRAGNADARPDLIIFADTGSEKPETIAFLPVMNAFLRANGFPEVTVVAKGRRGTSKDRSLHESCLRLHTMPSLAYGGKSCSLKWKAAEMDHWIGSWAPAIHARALGLPVVKLIGYDASPADLRRSANPGDAKVSFAYPLRDAGLTRPTLKGVIQLAGLPQPGKSACFMCPASKREEVVQLARRHPDLMDVALEIEAEALARSRAEGKATTTVGLGRKWNWGELLAAAAPLAKAA